MSVQATATSTTPNTRGKSHRVDSIVLVAALCSESWTRSETARREYQAEREQNVKSTLQRHHILTDGLVLGSSQRLGYGDVSKRAALSFRCVVEQWQQV